MLRIIIHSYILNYHRLLGIIFVKGGLMRKLKLIAAIMLFFIIGTSEITIAQKKDNVTPFRKGTLTAIVGAGIARDYKNLNSNSAFGTKGAIEYGIWKAGPGIISLGAEFGGAFSTGRDYYTDFKSRTIVLAARSAWHYGWKVPNLDTYGGLSTGVGFHQYDYKRGQQKINENELLPLVAVFVGASYFLTPKFGVNIEAGNDINTLQAGLVFKL